MFSEFSKITTAAFAEVPIFLKKSNLSTKDYLIINEIPRLVKSSVQ